MDESKIKARFWRRAQSFLSAVAAISKLLYPPNKKKNPHGAYLRASIGTGVTKAFDDATRMVRNHYEHIDEKIVDWWANSPNKAMADYNFWPLGRLEKELGGAINCFRNYDSRKNILTFMGNHLEVAAMTNAIAQLQKAIAERAARL